MQQRLTNLAESFPKTPMIASREMRRLLESDREAFREAAVNLLRCSQYGTGEQYILTLLVTNGLILDRLMDPNALELAEATEIARRILVSIDSFVDVKLTRALLPSSSGATTIRDSPSILRVLEIVASISDGSKVMTLLTQLLQHADVKVRSKASLLIGRINRNVGWVEKRMSEPDGRVRASAVECLWGMDSSEARQIFLSALTDPDNRVAGNGAVGLYRCGDLLAAEMLIDMLTNPEAKSRATAAWAMGQLADPRFLPALSQRLIEVEVTVRNRVFHAIASIRRRVRQCQDAGSLRVAITGAMTVDGVKRVGVMVLRADGQQLARLSPTEIVLTDSDRLINEITIQSRRECERIAAGFVVPRSTVREDPMGRALLDGVSVFLDYKHGNDAWAAAKYAVAAPRVQAQPVFRLESALLSSGSGGRHREKAIAEVDTAQDMEPIRLTVSPSALLAQCETVGLKSAAAESAPEALRRVLEALAGAIGHRTVFLFLSDGAQADWDAVSSVVLEAHTALYTVALNCGIPDSLRRICERSGGDYALASDPGELIAACERFACALTCLYTIEYAAPACSQPNGATSGQLKVQICSELGFGEAQLQPRAKAFEINAA